jgi:rod shape determining protein RodA
MIKRNLIRDFDIWLLLVTVLILGIGMAVIYSATYDIEGANYPARQFAWAGIGIIALFLGLLINYKVVMRFAYFLYFLNVGLLLLVLVSGRVVLGAQRWLYFGGFSFQPSELAKVTVIIVLARFLGDRKGRLTPWGLACAFMLVFAPMIFVIQQPDLGTALVMLPILFVLLYMAEAPRRYLYGLVIAGLTVSPFLWFILKDYQKSRLLVFLNPNIDPLGAGYATNQARIAVGSGGLFGKGWLSGTQTQLHFLPENRTDFVFATVGEEFGFIGAVVLLGLYAFIIIRGLQIAQQSRDGAGKLLASGISMMLLFHVFVNVGMAVGIVPVVGLPLPLVSYGGSCLVTMLLSIGLLMNVRMRRFTF